MTAISLDSTERKRLKGLAHHLDPVVRVGRSELTDGVVEETDRALQSHELIKVRIDLDEKPARRAIADELANRLSACHVDSIGKVAILWRENEDRD